MIALIDAHMIGERETGNETYIVNLIRGLKSINDDTELIIAVSNPDAAEKAIDGYNKRCRPVFVSTSPLPRLGWELTRICRKKSVDVLHVTYAGPLHSGCPMVATIHDVSFKANPQWFSQRDRLVLNVGVGVTVRNASRIITISDHSRAEISRYYPETAKRIDVTVTASAPQFRKLSQDDLDLNDWREKFGIRGPYVLAVGNLQPRKNLLRLVEAFARTVKDARIPHQLVIAGKAVWLESEVLRAVEFLNMSSRVLLPGYVSTDDLIRLFNAADLFVYPSLYEGFGLPVLESMACGTPVITSNTTSIPEVAGDAAILVDPTNTNAIANAIHELAADPNRRATMSAKGMIHAASFSWSSCAKATLDSYRLACRTR